MEVKGLAVGPMRDYVATKFNSRYEEWINSLPKESQAIIRNPLASAWYPIKPAIIDPTQKICDLFHKGDDRGAWEIGRFSADHALKGIYSIFIKLGSPGFIASRGSSIMSKYYNPSEMKVAENKEDRVLVHITQFPEPHKLIELRIGGWMERAIELSGKKVQTAKINKSLAKGDTVTEYLIEWQ